MRRVHAIAAALLLVGVPLALLLVPGCSSMNKSTIESRLLELPGNAAVRERGLERREADVVLDGRRERVEYVFYRAGEAGPDRPTILLVHGTPSSFATWTDVVFGVGGEPGLARDAHVVVLEMAGHGVTRTNVLPMTFQREAQWIGGFLDALDLRDVTIVGNSYGGEFAWRAALDRPDRIARLVLMSSSGFPRRADEWFPEEVKMREMSLAKIGWLLNARDRVRGALQPHFQVPVPDEHVEEVFVVCSNRENWSAMIDLARDENGLRAGDLAALKQPTLLLWGREDVAYPVERFARLFERTIPDARLLLVPRAGHYPQEEQPAFVAAALRAFARGDALPEGAPAAATSAPVGAAGK